MCIVEYADAHFYGCGIVPHKHKRTAYVVMRSYFKIMIEVIYFYEIA
jgi:hypothetical protein